MASLLVQQIFEDYDYFNLQKKEGTVDWMSLDEIYPFKKKAWN